MERTGTRDLSNAGNDWRALFCVIEIRDTAFRNLSANPAMIGPAMIPSLKPKTHNDDPRAEPRRSQTFIKARSWVILRAGSHSLQLWLCPLQYWPRLIPLASNQEFSCDFTIEDDNFMHQDQMMRRLLDS